jgi:hypothetical protein
MRALANGLMREHFCVMLCPRAQDFSQLMGWTAATHSRRWHVYRHGKLQMRAA